MEDWCETQRSQEGTWLLWCSCFTILCIYIFFSLMNTEWLLSLQSSYLYSREKEEKIMHKEQLDFCSLTFVTWQFLDSKEAENLNILLLTLKKQGEKMGLESWAESTIRSYDLSCFYQFLIFFKSKLLIYISLIINEVEQW